MVRKGTRELTIDGSSAELAGRRLLLEEVVDLSKGPVLGLRKEEEDPDHPEQAEAKVKHASLRTPIPCGGIVVEHAGVELLHSNLATDVEGTTDDDGLSTNTGRGHFTHDDIGGRAERDLESDLDENEENSDGDGNFSGGIHGETHDANYKHAEADGCRTEEVEGTAANPAHCPDSDCGGEDVD